jgi:MYXO-CTERM domain-containing protein
MTRLRAFARPQLLLAVALLLAITCASGTSPAQPAQGFVIAPYLQDLQSTTAILRFELREPSAATVEVTTSSKAVKRFESGTVQRFHSVRLAGLEPATTSSYLVRAGASASERATFTTAPADGSPPFSFILYGDSRSDAAAHASIVRAIEAIPSNFLIGTGDIVDTGADRNGWLEFFSIEQRLLRDRCLFSVVGNHELEQESRSPRRIWMRHFAPHDDDQGPSYYTFRRGNTRFFLLDAMDTWQGAQAQWLRAELERADAETGLAHRFVVTHHAPFSSGPHGPNRAFLRAGMVDVLSQHKVDLLMAGHDHIYERGAANGIKYIISGGAGAPLYAPDKAQPGSGKALSIHHFVEVRVEGPSVSMVARKADKSVIEHCQYRGSEPWACDGAIAAPSAVASAKSEAPAVSGAQGGPSSLPPARTSTRCGCEVPGASTRWPDKAALALGLAAIVAAVRRRRAGRP